MNGVVLLNEWVKCQNITFSTPSLPLFMARRALKTCQNKAPVQYLLSASYPRQHHALPAAVSLTLFVYT